MSNSDSRRRLPLRAARGLVTLLAVVPLALTGFVVGYGVGAGGERGSGPGPGASHGPIAPGEAEHEPVAATFTATAIDGPAPDAPSVLPVGNTEGLGITVTHIQFDVDEATVLPSHTAELRLPVLVPPGGDPMLVEVASVRPAGCLCGLTAATAPPYGRVWDAAVVDAAASEVVFDVSGAIDAPGRYVFAITSPDLDGYLELEGADHGDGPRLRTVPESAATTDRPTPPIAPEAGQADSNLETCRTGEDLVPSCGVLTGAAAGAHTNRPKEDAFLEFEELAGRTQHVYHAYERADRRLWPTERQIELATDPERPRTLFINWKPRMATWAQIAAGDPEVDAYLTRLAAHIQANFDRPFFFTVHHEPENDVVDLPGSGMEAEDYPKMFRYVVEFLRERGVDNLVTVMNYMGYLKWVEMPWHDRLWPGDDVVDWIGVSGYGQSLSDDGHSDFSEIVDQTVDGEWPGFYHWTGTHHPDKPMMLAEWGVFAMDDYPHHQETVFRSAVEQLAHYPRLKAVVYFSSPDAEGRNSEIDTKPESLAAFQDLMASPRFDVRLD